MSRSKSKCLKARAAASTPRAHRRHKQGQAAATTGGLPQTAPPFVVQDSGCVPEVCGNHDDDDDGYDEAGGLWALEASPLPASRYTCPSRASIIALPSAAIPRHPPPEHSLAPNTPKPPPTSGLPSPPSAAPRPPSPPPPSRNNSPPPPSRKAASHGRNDRCEMKGSACCLTISECPPELRDAPPPLPTTESLQVTKTSEMLSRKHSFASCLVQRFV